MGSAPPVAVDRSQPRAQPAPLVPLAIAGVGGIAAGLALGGPPAAWWGLGGLALVAGLAVTGARSRLLAVLGFAALGLARGTSASPPPPPPDVAPVWDVEVVRAVPEPGREPVRRQVFSYALAQRARRQLERRWKERTQLCPFRIAIQAIVLVVPAPIGAGAGKVVNRNW